MGRIRNTSNIRQKIQNIYNSQLHTDIQDAWLGQTSTSAPSSGANPGYVWARLGNEQSAAIQVKNRAVKSGFPNLKVYVGKARGSNAYEVIGVHSDVSDSQPDYAGTLNIPDQQPQLLYGERVFPERITNLRMYPDGSGLILAVEPGYYRKPDGTWVGFLGDTVDLTSYVPGTVNQKRILLIGIVYSTGALTVDSTASPISMYTEPKDGKLFTQEDIATALNAAPDTAKWLGAIPLIYGQTHLQWLFQYTALGYVAETLAGQYVAKSGDTMTGALTIDGSADTPQLVVGAASGQTNAIFVVQDENNNNLMFFAADGKATIDLNTALTGASNILTIGHRTSGTPAAGFGGTFLFRADTNGGEAQTQQSWFSTWADATHATRRARSTFFVNGTTAANWLQAERNTSTGADVVFNEAGVDSDLRIEGDTDTHLFFADGSQDNIGIGTSTPNTSAKLDINSTVGALLLPRMSTTQRNALTATNGMGIYNTTANQMEKYEAGAWVAW